MRPAPPDPETYTGRDDARQYLVTKWPDGSLELATRPLAGGVWSPGVRLGVAS